MISYERNGLELTAITAVVPVVITAMIVPMIAITVVVAVPVVTGWRAGINHDARHTNRRRDHHSGRARGLNDYSRQWRQRNADANVYSDSCLGSSDAAYQYCSG